MFAPFSMEFDMMVFPDTMMAVPDSIENISNDVSGFILFFMRFLNATICFWSGPKLLLRLHQVPVPWNLPSCISHQNV